MQTHYINGKWEEGTGSLFSSKNPATKETLWEGKSAEENALEKAISSGRKAFGSWNSLPIEKRLKIIESFKQKLETHTDLMAKTISEETGKPLWECKEEVGAMGGKVKISIEAFQERCPEKSFSSPAGTAHLRHKPHGVLAIFGPFNFPGHLPNGHIVPALIAGNCCIFKPSDQTPLTAQKMVEIWEEAGLPPGVLQLVQGEVATGVALANHPGIDGLLFTGSARVGLDLAAAFAKRPGKILALEMGGNNPLLVHEVSDLKGAAYTALLSAYLTAGQRCTCARRLILPKGSEGDAFLDLLQEMIPSIKVAPPTETPEPFFGPLINLDSAKRVLAHQESLIKKGGALLCKMEQKDPTLPFVTPGLIDVTAVKNLEDEEFFAPLLHVIRTSGFEQACEEANNTSYGLSSGILSDNKALYETFYKTSRAGIVNWNTPLTGASSALPFGGWGKSGNFRPSAYYAADYCSYPVASMEKEKVVFPENLKPGIAFQTGALS